MFPPSLLGPLYLQSRAKVATVMVTLRWEGEQGEPFTAVLGPLPHGRCNGIFTSHSGRVAMCFENL